jgi:hypothetical protein
LLRLLLLLPGALGLRLRQALAKEIAALAVKTIKRERVYKNSRLVSKVLLMYSPSIPRPSHTRASVNNNLAPSRVPSTLASAGGASWTVLSFVIL